MKKSYITIIATIIALTIFNPVIVSADTVSEDTFKELDNYGYIPEDTSIYDFNHQSRNRKTKLRNTSSTHASRYISASDGTTKPDGTPNIDLYASNQGELGLCWLFSTNKAIEFNIYKKNNTKPDLSEKNTAYYYFHQAGEGSEGNALLNAYNYYTTNTNGGTDVLQDNACYSVGGNASMLDNYFAAWKGITADKNNDSFGYYPMESILVDPDYPVPDVNNVYSNGIAHIKNIAKVNPTDSNGIKNLIEEYGAATLAVGTSSYTNNHSYPAWFANPSYASVLINHQVIIIGWDDNYPKENFPSDKYIGTAQHDGAWYCMNSWDSSPRSGVLDSNGCFWLSYEDGSLNDSYNPPVVAYEVSLPDDSTWYDHNYIGGSACSEKIRQIAVDSYGIVYTAQGKNNTTGFEKIKGVGFSTFETNTKWTVKIYKGDSNEGTPETVKTVTIPEIGFHTIDLNTPIYVKEGSEFYVEVIPETGSDATIEYVIPEDSYTDNYDGRIRYNNKTNYFDLHVQYGKAFGKSYIDGTYDPEKQLLIHAYTVDTTVEASTSTLSANDITVTYGAADIAAEDYFTFTAGTDDEGNNPESIKSIVSDNEDCVTVNSDYSLTFKNAGNAKITITTTDGITAEANITVNPISISSCSIYGYSKYQSGWRLNSDSESAVGKTIYYTKTLTEEEDPFSLTFILTNEITGTLTENEDYTIEYSNNNKTGIAKVTISGIGNYKDITTKTYNIIYVKNCSYDITFDDPFDVNVGDTIYIPEFTGFQPGVNSYGIPVIIKGIELWSPFEDEMDKIPEMASISGNYVTFLKAGSLEYLRINTSEEIEMDYDFRNSQLLSFNISDTSNNNEDDPNENNSENNDPNNENNQENTENEENQNDLENQEENNNPENNNSENSEDDEENNENSELNEENNGNSQESEENNSGNNSDDNNENQNESNLNENTEENNESSEENNNKETVIDNNEEDNPSGNIENDSSEENNDNPSVPGKDNKENNSEENPVNEKENPENNDEPSENNPSEENTDNNDSKNITEPEDNGNEYQEPSVEPSKPESEPVETNEQAIEATFNGYTATVNLNKSVPFCKKKKEVVSNLKINIKVTDSEGNLTGMYLKSVKSTKPKNGTARVTVMLKGSDKAERKIAKRLNKQLKKIPVEVENA